MFALSVENLKFGYKKELVLKDISFKIKKGEFVSIIGPNGSGKSTILKLLNHLYSPKIGEILIEGKNINSFRRKDLARKMALVPQDTFLDYEFTVEDVVLMGRHPHKKRFHKDNEDDLRIVEEALELTNTTDLRDKLINEISGGERQRVIIARALAQNPSIILLDEPTSHLDINHQIEILNLLKKLNEEKDTTIIVVIHDINLASRYSDNLILVHEGEIMDIGSPEKVITEKNIKEIYNLDVIIEKNPFTNKIFLTPE